MSEEFLGDLITVQPQSPKIPIHLRRTNTNLTYEQHQQKENERLQKDLQEKENYLSKLEGEVELLKECMVAFRKLISDVEISTGEDFLTREQKLNLANMPYNQAMTIIKSELVFLVKRQEELPKKYENQFIENVTKITDEIEAVEKKTQTLQKQRANITKRSKVFDRFIQISKSEKESLQRVVDSLETKIKTTTIENTKRTNNKTAELQSLKTSIIKANNDLEQEEQLNKTLSKTLNLPPKKTIVDMLNDDHDLTQICKTLQQKIEIERKDTNDVLAELAHTQNEIQRAKETIMKYQINVNNETRKYAINVNKDMRQFIQEQREEWDRKLLSQKKHNKDLERQILEMQEEQSMLQPFLVSLEKRLQQEMLKLPSLTDPNQRLAEMRRSGPIMRATKRDMEDSEMRNVRKTLLQIKARRLRSQTANLK